MFNKGNKRSLVLIIVGVFWISYIAITSFQFYGQVRETVNTLVADKQIRMAYTQDQIFSSLIAGNLDVVKDQLDKARKVYLIDFYILQSNSDVLYWHNNGDLQAINNDYQTFNQWLATDKLAFRTLKVFEYKLTTGVFQDRAAIMKETAWLMRGYIVREVLSVTAALSIIVFLVLKDIIQLSKMLSSSNRKDLHNLKATSSEAEALINASMGLEGERQRLSSLSETYSQTVGPAIVHEIRSGKPTPYQFKATICRVDLNGYTQLMLEKDPGYLNQILNTYFATARETIQRYGGLIYQFVGDEIIFEFKDDLSLNQNSVALATACIRDLFAQAKALEDSLPESANHYFKLKASFARGNMRFVSLDEGHALSGVPLIESVRLLSTVEDKTNQILTFFEEDFKENEQLVLICDRKQNQLKGFKESSNICSSRDFRSIDWLFSNQSWSLLAYYRCDSDLIYTLKKIRQYAASSEVISLNEIFANLKFHEFTQISELLYAEAKLTLFSLIELEKNKTISEKVLSSFISLFQRIVPQHQRNEESQSLLKKLLSHSDFRVQANTVMAIGPSKTSLKELRSHAFSKNNRLAADAIVELAKIEVDKNIQQALLRLLEHPSPVYKKSGEYARKKVLEFYKLQDPVFYESNPILNSLKKFNKAAA